MKKYTYAAVTKMVDEWNERHGLRYRDKGHLCLNNDAEVHWLSGIIWQGSTGTTKLLTGMTDGSLKSCALAIPYLPTPDPVKPPKLGKGDRGNFATLLRAVGDGEVALVSAIRKEDRKPVALVCAMQRNDDDTLTPIPFAVMVEGNPFELFEDPTAV